MKICLKCNKEFNTWVRIEGKRRNLNSRKFCLDCSPFLDHNTRDITIYCVAQENDSEKWCNNCKQLLPITDFYLRKDRVRNRAHTYCKKCCNSITIEKQSSNKLKLVEYKGGKCCCCDYNRSLGALEFHHINPGQKDFNLCNTKSYSFKTIKDEIDKCILVCANCHREIHTENILVIVENVSRPELESGTESLKGICSTLS